MSLIGILIERMKKDGNVDLITNRTRIESYL